MQILTKNIPILPSLMDPLGDNSHLILLSFRDETELQGGLRAPVIYCLYSKSLNSIGQITEVYAGEIALTEVMRDAETSKPVDRCLEK